MSAARDRRGGFTLIELLLAAGVFAMLAAALLSVFHGAMQLRETAAATFAQDRPRQYAVETMLRDFRNMLPPAGVLAGDMVGEDNEEAAGSLDTVAFYATTGRVTDALPWGDLVHVTYLLEETEVEGSYDLVRYVERNLLASTDETEEEELLSEEAAADEVDDGDETYRLLEGVASLDITYYDGESWLDSWDSTTEGNVLPKALSVRIDFAVEEDEAGEETAAAAPIELLYEPVCAAAVQEVATEGGDAP